MRAGSLFAGIGGLDIALRGFGVETAWFSENDKYASQVLKRHWPEVPNHSDITKIDWSKVEPVEMLHGGFPCQDLSLAGKGAGITGSRSGLWSSYANAIDALRPRFVFVENVAALLVRGMDRVLADLSSLGFDAEWCSLRASAIGAPHPRNRIWILARNTHLKPGQQRWEPGSREAESWWSRPNAGRPSGALAADSEGERWGERILRGGTSTQLPQPGSNDQVVADTYSDGRQSGWERNGQEVQPEQQASQRDDPDGLGEVAWGEFEPAIRRWERIRNQPSPSPVGERGRLSPEFEEWMMGYPQGWTFGCPPSQRLKMLGNAVVPQCASAAFENLMIRSSEWENAR